MTQQQEMERWALITAQEQAAHELIENSTEEYLFFETEEAALGFADYETFTIWACDLCDFDGEYITDDGVCFVVARNEIEAVIIATHYSRSIVQYTEEV